MSKKMVHVDDEVSIQKLVAANMQRAGYEVFTVSSGKEGLEKIKAEKPDLVVMEFALPDMGGDEFLKAVRADLETQYLPVIVLSWDKGDAAVWAMVRAGADYVLGKPFNAGELLEFAKRLTSPGYFSR